MSVDRPNPEDETLTGSAAEVLPGRWSIAAGRDAWVRVTADADAGPFRHVTRLFDRGGTVALFDEVAGLARHAVTVGAYLSAADIEQARLLRRWARVPATDVEVVTGLLLSAAVNASRWSVARWPVVAGWLRVLAGDCDLERAAGLWDGLDDWAAPVDAFPMGGLGAVGPLAYAAGLTGAEALARVAAGDLDPVGLGALAALRGYRLPSLASRTADDGAD